MHQVTEIVHFDNRDVTVETVRNYIFDGSLRKRKIRQDTRTGNRSQPSTKTKQ